MRPIWRTLALVGALALGTAEAGAHDDDVGGYGRGYGRFDVARGYEAYGPGWARREDYGYGGYRRHRPCTPPPPPCGTRAVADWDHGPPPVTRQYTETRSYRFESYRTSYSRPSWPW